MTRDVDLQLAGDTRRYKVNLFPDTCPICNYAIDARYKGGYILENKLDYAQILFQCPRMECQHLFIGYYSKIFSRFSNDHIYGLRTVAPQVLKDRKFSDVITLASKNFVLIFNQAQQAEALGLLEIAGPGYRKALEFLVKDYAIKQNPDAEEKIKEKYLASVINDYVSDTKIKSTATRATWLGNDETHYYRRWEDKDLRDMKVLIDLTLHWIESEELTRQYEEEMKN